MKRTSTDVLSNGIRHRVHHFTGEMRSPLPEPRTVLLIHGFLDAGSTWDLVAEHLVTAGYEVIAPDLRGFGESGRVPPGGYYHFPDYVADVDGLVDQLVRARRSEPDGAPPPWLAVVGHSMGGGVASLWAGTRPERLERLAILEGLGPAMEPPELGVDRMRAWLRDLARIDREPRVLGTLDDATNKLAATHPRIDKELLRTRALHLVATREDGQVSWAHDPLHRSLSPTPFQPEVLKGFLAKITCPTLYVSGGETGWHPPDEAERLAMIRDLKSVTFADAGHMMHWTAPSEVATALVAFFA